MTDQSEIREPNFTEHQLNLMLQDELLEMRLQYHWSIKHEEHEYLRIAGELFRFDDIKALLGFDSGNDIEPVLNT